MPPWPELTGGFAAVERWLIPAECMLCHAVLPATPRDPLICPTCTNRWSPLGHPRCARCGQPLAPGIECRLCTAWPTGFGGVASAVWLDQGARRAVHLLKYDGWWRMSEVLADVIRQHVPVPPGSTLVPIPLGAARLSTRGYNQSAVLANALGRLLGLPVSDHAIRRRRETTTQTALTPDERRANLAGAFEPVGPPPARPVLVDDVFTTGATLAEAAAALLFAGARDVSAVTFARAQRPLADAAAALSDVSQPL